LIFLPTQGIGPRSRAGFMFHALETSLMNEEILNVNGGVIALGHLLGCSGARMTTALLYEMHRCGIRFGLATMCVGGGMGAAGIFEPEE